MSKVKIILKEDDDENIGHKAPINKVLCLPEGGYVSCSRDTTLRKWNLDEDSKELIQGRIFEGHKGWISDGCLTEDLILSSSHDRTIKIWNSHTGEDLDTLRGHSDFVECLTMGDTTDKLVSAGLQGEVILWDLHSGVADSTIKDESPMSSFYCCDMSMNLIVAAGTDFSVKLWDNRTRDVMKRLDGHTDLVRAISLQNYYCISASVDGSVRLWDLRNSREQLIAKYKTSVNHANRFPILSLQCDKSFTKAYISGQEIVGSHGIKRGYISEIDLVSGTMDTLLEHQTPIFSISYDDKNNCIIYSSTEGTRCHYLTENEDNIPFEFPFKPYFQDYAVLNDGKSILCEYSDGLIKKWDILASEILETYHNEDLELLTQKCFIEKKVPSWFSVEKGHGDCVIVLEESIGLNGVTTLGREEVNFGQIVLKKIYADYIIYNKVKIIENQAEKEEDEEEEKKTENKKPSLSKKENEEDDKNNEQDDNKTKKMKINMNEKEQQQKQPSSSEDEQQKRNHSSSPEQQKKKSIHEEKNDNEGNLGGSTSEVAGRRQLEAKEKNNDEDKNTEEVGDHSTAEASTATTTSTSSATQQSQSKKENNNNIKKKVQPKKRVINFDESDFKEMKTSIPLWINNAIQYEANIVRGRFPKLPFRLVPCNGGVLPPLAAGESLNGPGHFTMQKVLEYICRQVNQTNEIKRKIIPEDVKIIARGQEIPMSFDIRTLAEFWFNNPKRSRIVHGKEVSRDVVIYYDLKEQLDI